MGLRMLMRPYSSGRLRTPRTPPHANQMLRVAHVYRVPKPPSPLGMFASFQWQVTAGRLHPVMVSPFKVLSCTEIFQRSVRLPPESWILIASPLALSG